MTVRSPAAELAELLHRSTVTFDRAILSLAKASAGDSREELGRAFDRLTTLLGETMTLADLYGRRRALLEFDAAAAANPEGIDPLDLPAAAFSSTTPVVPGVPFETAVKDLLTREPRLASSWQEVAEIYRTRHAFASARSTAQSVTERLQRAIAQALEEGRTLATAELQVAEIGDWSRAYAETVYRTNMTTAYSAGRIRQAFDPDVGRVMLAFELIGPRDRDARVNHAAGVGLVAGKTDPIWDFAAPPLGYNCRHQLRCVSRMELQRMGLLDGDRVLRRIPPNFARFHPDEGFGGRPDLQIYRG